MTVAAETMLARSLPGLIAGTAPRRPQPILPGEYFGRRTPEDGRIDWQRPAREIHDLVRAVAPPFPGAFAQVAGERWEIQRTRLSTRTPPAAGLWLFGAGRRGVRGLRRRRRAAAAGCAQRERGARPRAPGGGARGATRCRSAEPAMALVALKIDVDTYRGTREGALRLAELLERLGRARDLSLQPGS